MYSLTGVGSRHSCARWSNAHKKVAHGGSMHTSTSCLYTLAKKLVKINLTLWDL